MHSAEHVPVVQAEVHQRLVAVVVAVGHAGAGLYVPEFFVAVGLEVIALHGHRCVLVILVVIAE